MTSEKETLQEKISIHKKFKSQKEKNDWVKQKVDEKTKIMQTHIQNSKNFSKELQDLHKKQERMKVEISNSIEIISKEKLEVEKFNDKINQLKNEKTKISNSKMYFI